MKNQIEIVEPSSNVRRQLPTKCPMKRPTKSLRRNGRRNPPTKSDEMIDEKPTNLSTKPLDEIIHSKKSFDEILRRNVIDIFQLKISKKSCYQIIRRNFEEFFDEINFVELCLAFCWPFCRAFFLAFCRAFLSGILLVFLPGCYAWAFCLGALPGPKFNMCEFRPSWAPSWGSN